MKQPIFLKPVLQDKIWGGIKLRTQFNLPTTSDTVGEAWCISAHPNGVSTVMSPSQFVGMGLDQLYQTQPELFGNPKETVFPLLVKLLDAKEALSVQVHPEDQYALTNEGELGKTECWYVIDAEPGATIVYGHRAKTRQEFERYVSQGAWQELLVEVPVKAGDFFDVPAGTIHAIGSGVVILETQQSSDTTYRVYDYDRVDATGQTRELHLQQAADVTLFPDADRTLAITETKVGESVVTHYVNHQLFSVSKWQVSGELVVDLSGAYTLVTVIAGAGEVAIEGVSYPIKLADSFIVPSGVPNIHLTGNLIAMCSHPNA